MTPATADIRALGTGIRIVAAPGADIDRARDAVVAELAAFDTACSRFRADSELTAVNQSDGSWIRVSGLLMLALETAVRAAELTDGLVDPTVGSALRQCGYDDDFSSLPLNGPALALRVRPVPGWRLVQLNRRASSVRIPRGVELDLGATAKALASDRAAARAAEAAGGGVLVSCGGDVAIAGEPIAGGWTVRACEDNDERLSRPGQDIQLEVGGLATSGTTARRWRRGGQRFHHLIDPRTGLPASTRWSYITVAAASCADANIASTAAIILDDRAAGWLTDHGLAARLVANDGTVHAVGGWPAEAAA